MICPSNQNKHDFLWNAFSLICDICSDLIVNFTKFYSVCELCFVFCCTHSLCCYSPPWWAVAITGTEDVEGGETLDTTQSMVIKTKQRISFRFRQFLSEDQAQ